MFMAGANVLELNSANWEQEVTSSSIPVLVDFWAPWCGPCRSLGPTIDKLSTSFARRVTVGKLNTDENQDLAVKYGITSIPRVMIFKGGDKPREQVVGLRSEGELSALLNKVLES